MSRSLHFDTLHAMIRVERKSLETPALAGGFSFAD